MLMLRKDVEAILNLNGLSELHIEASTYRPYHLVIVGKCGQLVSTTNIGVPKKLK